MVANDSDRMKYLNPIHYWLSIVLYCFLNMACHNSKTITVVPHTKIRNEKTVTQTYIIYAPIVLKDFYKKVGQKKDPVQEHYIQHSAQDYFIKFCEGKVTKSELETALSKQKGHIKTLKMEVSFRDGTWDNCGEAIPYAATRTGRYAVIMKIFGK